MKTSNVTILLTLKGRHLHTLRWLWHANRTRLPFHVVIADGQVHPTIARLLSNPFTFPELSFEYHQYEDTTFTDFYNKCVDALNKVRTPYVMMSDNDDFLFPTGLRRSASFLDGAPEFVCAGGSIPGFFLDSQASGFGKVVGPLHRIRSGDKCRDLDNPSIAVRALDELQNRQTVYYNVYRIEALRTIAQEIQAYDFSDLIIHENFWAMRTVTLGKVRSDASSFSYFRQGGTSACGSYKVDWVYDLLGSRFPQDYRALASKVATVAALADGSDPVEIESRIREAYAKFLRTMLAGTMLRHRFPRLFALKQRLLALQIGRIIPAAFQRRLDETKFWKQLALDGADEKTIAAHKMEFNEIEATLQGDEFIQYVRYHAPDLLP